MSIHLTPSTKEKLWKVLCLIEEERQIKKRRAKSSPAEPNIPPPLGIDPDHLDIPTYRFEEEGVLQFDAANILDILQKEEGVLSYVEWYEDVRNEDGPPLPHALFYPPSTVEIRIRGEKFTKYLQQEKKLQAQSLKKAEVSTPMRLVLYADQYLGKPNHNRNECYLFKNRKGKPPKRYELFLLFNQGERLSSQKILETVSYPNKETANKEVGELFKAIAKKIVAETEDLYEHNANGYKLKCEVITSNEMAPLP